MIQNKAFLLVKINIIYIFKYYQLKKSYLEIEEVKFFMKLILGNIYHYLNLKLQINQIIDLI